MGIKERRVREQEELRQSILKAVRNIATTEGWQAVTVRKIADRIEYSPPMIYEYFSSKEAIIDELRKEGFRRLLADLQAAYRSTENPVQQFMKMAIAYWEFAWKQPEMYQAMHGLDGVPCDPNLYAPEANDAFMLSCSVLERIAIVSGKPIPDVQGAVGIVRAMLHGFIALMMAARMEKDNEYITELIKRGIRDLLNAWGATS